MSPSTLKGSLPVGCRAPEGPWPEQDTGSGPWSHRDLYSTLQGSFQGTWDCLWADIRLQDTLFHATLAKDGPANKPYIVKSRGIGLPAHVFGVPLLRGASSFCWALGRFQAGCRRVLYGPREFPTFWTRMSNVAVVSYTFNIRQTHIGNCLRLHIWASSFHNGNTRGDLSQRASPKGSPEQER